MSAPCRITTKQPASTQATPLHTTTRGIIYQIKGDYDRAIADYDEAIWLRNGDYPAAFYNRALAYADKGEYEHSLADFDVVLRFNAKNALALYARGLTLLKKGDAEAGAADIAAAKSIKPNIAEQFGSLQIVGEIKEFLSHIQSLAITASAKCRRRSRGARHIAEQIRRCRCRCAVRKSDRTG